MKRLFLCALVVAVCSQALFAQSTQPCIVLQYNQKEAKSPLPGVEVMASNAGSTVSDNAGKLTLSFRTLKPGDKVNLISARKAGFELFNAEAVAQWTISRDQSPFTLVMVKKDYFDQLKAKLTQTSTDSYRTKYEQAARELEQQKKAGKLKEEEFNRKYDALEAQCQTQLSNLDNLSLLYSATQDFEKALEAIDKAIELTPEDAGCHETKEEILRKMDEKKGLTKE